MSRSRVSDEHCALCGTKGGHWCNGCRNYICPECDFMEQDPDTWRHTLDDHTSTL
jgi:hypothetical protein